MQSMIPVSALVLTYNEEKNIARCLKSLTWANEIVVIDAKSQDRTRQICEDPSKPWASKIRWIERAWSGFKDQRNFSLNQAKHDWVFVVDADEECTPELKAKIQEILSSPPAFQAYKVHRIEYFVGIPIRHGMWNPSYQDRFFNKKGIRYINEVHEYPPFPSTPGKIHEPLLHDPNHGVEQFMNKLNFYTTLEAKDRFEQGQRTNLFHLLLTFPAMSLKSYFYYGAWKDGLAGIIISLLEGISRTIRHIKLWQLQVQKSQSRYTPTASKDHAAPYS